jgi:hypothetical protein
MMGTTSIAFRRNAPPTPYGPQFAAAEYPEGAEQPVMSPEEAEVVEAGARAYELVDRALQANAEAINRRLSRMKAYSGLSTTPELLRAQIQAGVVSKERGANILAAMEGKALTEEQAVAVRDKLEEVRPQTPLGYIKAVSETASEYAPVEGVEASGFARSFMPENIRIQHDIAVNNMERLKEQYPWAQNMYSEQDLYIAQFDESHPANTLYEYIDVQKTEYGPDGEVKVKERNALRDLPEWRDSLTDSEEESAQKTIEWFGSLNPADQGVVVDQFSQTLAGQLPPEQGARLKQSLVRIMDVDKKYNLPEGYDVEGKVDQSIRAFADKHGDDLYEQDRPSEEALVSNLADKIQRRMGKGETLASATTKALQEGVTYDKNLLTRAVRGAHAQIISEATGDAYQAVKSLTMQAIATGRIRAHESLEEVMDIVTEASEAERAKYAQEVLAAEDRAGRVSFVREKAMAGIAEERAATLEGVQDAIAGETAAGLPINVENTLIAMKDAATDKKRALSIVVEQMRQANTPMASDDPATSTFVREELSRIDSLIKDEDVTWAQIKKHAPKYASAAEKVQELYSADIDRIEGWQSKFITKREVQRRNTERKAQRTFDGGEAPIFDVADGEQIIAGTAPYEQLEDMRLFFGRQGPTDPVYDAMQFSEYAVDTGGGNYVYTTDKRLKQHVRNFGADTVKTLAGSTPNGAVGDVYKVGDRVRKGNYVDSAVYLLNGEVEKLKDVAYPGGGVYLTEEAFTDFNKTVQKVIDNLSLEAGVSEDDRSRKAQNWAEITGNSEWLKKHDIDESLFNEMRRLKILPRFQHGAELVKGGDPEQQVLGSALMWDSMLRAVGAKAEQHQLKIQSAGSAVRRFANDIKEAVKSQRGGLPVDIEELRNSSRRITRHIADAQSAEMSLSAMGRKAEGIDDSQELKKISAEAFEKANIGEGLIAEVAPIQTLLRPEIIEKALSLPEEMSEYESLRSALTFASEGTPAPSGGDAFKQIRGEVNGAMNQSFGTIGNEYVHDAVGAATSALQNTARRIYSAYSVNEPHITHTTEDALVSKLNESLSERGGGKLTKDQESELRRLYKSMLAEEYLEAIEDDLRDTYAEEIRGMARPRTGSIDPEVPLDRLRRSM